MGSDRRLPCRQSPKPSNRSPAILPSIILTVSVGIVLVPSAAAESRAANDFEPSRFHDLYTSHCAREVFSEYPISATASSNDSLSGQLRFSGFFAPAATKADDPRDMALSRFLFYPEAVYGTNNKDVLKVVGSLRLCGRGLSLSRAGGLGRQRLKTTFHVRGPRIPVRRGWYRFSLTGYAVESTGRLCLVGTSVRFNNVSSGDVVLKVRYPIELSINTRFVRGEFESLGDSDGKGEALGRVSLLGFSGRMDYGYSLMLKEKDGSFDKFDSGDGDNLSLNEIQGKVGGWCSSFRWLSSFEMEYGGGCDAVNCNPLGKDGLFVPNRIFLSTLPCSDQGKLQFVLSFRNSSIYSDNAFNPRSLLLGEGEWDLKAKRICGVACRMLNYTESLVNTFVGDCSIKLCMRFPAIFSIINRSFVVGPIWTTNAIDDSGYFPKIAFQSYGPSYMNRRYKYGVMGGSPNSCEQSAEVQKKKVYPFPSSSDTRFNFLFFFFFKL